MRDTLIPSTRFEFRFRVLLHCLVLYAVTYMHTFNAWALIHFRLHPCSLPCSGA